MIISQWLGFVWSTDACVYEGRCYSRIVYVDMSGTRSDCDNHEENKRHAKWMYDEEAEWVYGFKSSSRVARQ
jgi:hypothetical protein